ncbi:MAG: orotidine-5'-phosphate decarboxylase [Kiritimatiellaeota bacterium]|nr:orotidine-5'-phosphate decarboxylase [Kiritimatiellota bacterium]
MKNGNPKRVELMVALDVSGVAEADRLVTRIGDTVEWYKIGKQLFTRCGPEAVTRVKALGKKVFLDLKFHDIPNTVAGAVRSAGAIGADMTNVHAAGGPTMLRAAAEAAEEVGIILVAVTVLTSLGVEDLAAVGISGGPEAQVVRLARLVRKSGLAGVVCSPLEIEVVRAACGPDFLLVVPGIRPSGVGTQDQKRTMTPEEAVRAGADYLVVGRPITRASDPAAAAERLRASCETAIRR